MQKKLYNNKWLILCITALSPFMATLDASVVNIALPVMAKNLKVDSSAVSWIINAYLITLVSTILAMGKWGDLRGQTKVFQFGVIFFTIGSICCSLSPNFTCLIISRVIQAFGAGATMANSQGIIAKTFPIEERGKALGINGAFVALGILAGPSIGGFIISVAGWPYMFWVNVPIGILTFISGILIFPKEKTKSGKLNIKSVLIFALAMVSFFYGLQESQRMGFTNPIILVCFLIAIILTAYFIKTQKNIATPLLDIRIFNNKWYTVSIICAFTSFIGIACFSLIMPFYLQDIRNMSPAVAGLYMTIYPLILVFLSPLSGSLANRVGAEKLTLVGLTLTVIGLIAMISLNITTPLKFVVIFIIILGLGNGMFQSPNNFLVFNTLDKNQYGVGGSVNALVRTVGQAMGTALSTMLLYAGMSLKLGKHTTDFIQGQDHAFIFGMRIAWITVAAICAIGVYSTAKRLMARKPSKF